MSNNPFMRRNPSGGIEHGKASEKRLAKSLDAKLTPASGARAGAKGDMVKTNGKTKFRIEAKSTVNVSLSLDLGWLVKIAEEALARGENPMLAVSFVLPGGNPRRHGEWVMVPKYLADEIFDAVP